jgi:protein involved in sex pheromone biosynthesis
LPINMVKIANQHGPYKMQIETGWGSKKEMTIGRDGVPLNECDIQEIRNGLLRNACDRWDNEHSKKCERIYVLEDDGKSISMRKTSKDRNKQKQRRGLNWYPYGKVRKERDKGISQMKPISRSL